MKTLVLESLFTIVIDLKDTFCYETPLVTASVPWVDEFSVFSLFT